MKRLAALVLAALMILGMTACGQKKDESKSKLDQIKEAGVLVVGTSADYSPFESSCATCERRSVISLGGSKSGKPCDRLTAP